MQKDEVSGFVLVGGKSTRMGQDKALLNFRGQPLLVHMLELVRPFCNERFISGSSSDYLSFGVDMVPDVYQEIGPISGIFSALTSSQRDWNLIVSVDVPMVNQELLQYLVENRHTYDAVVPVHSNGAEPLIALYHKSIIPALREMIDGQDYRLMNLFSRINSNFLDCNTLIGKYPQLFLNLNRPEDYRAIQSLSF